jgi:hypothetical protein
MWCARHCAGGPHASVHGRLSIGASRILRFGAVQIRGRGMVTVIEASLLSLRCSERARASTDGSRSEGMRMNAAP